ncbi:protein kinase, partial [Acidobacteria bacterium AH-259-L09]|nr:protein kinase [Acidobacteria bacterium AH-259-L09]
MIGQTVSHYKILEKLGEGGMGEVFLAQDTLLDRKVALKFLPDFMQQDPTARKRFLREAKSAAALDHPFICKIYETGEAEGKDFISMEYVQGTTLKEKLAEGPLALKGALRKAAEIAEALEAAHKHDIVHRDLKPSNIMLTPEGHVKVMDFGLAKRLVPVEGLGSQEQTISASLTKMGATLGTLAYMSPEQFRGEDVDTRSDIFSFGVTLYEMLTGVHPFKKGTSLETANAMLNEVAAPLFRHMNEVPPVLQHTVRKMLAKEADRRYQLVHDVGTNLQELINEMADPSIQTKEAGIRPFEATGVPMGKPAGERSWRRAMLVGLLALVVGTIAAGVAFWSLKRPTPHPLKKLAITFPPTAPLARSSFRPNLAISPDGSRIVYCANRDGTLQLYLRLIDQLEATPIPGTEGALAPFFSADGEWVGFYAGGKLKKVSLRTGASLTLCDGPAAWGASWAPTDKILFVPGAAMGIWQVSAGGGERQVLVAPDFKKGERSYRWPQVLPGSKAVLFTIGSTTSASYDDANIAVLSLETGEHWIVVKGGSYARYAPTGHLVYARAGELLAVPFDLERLKITGPPVSILQGVMMNPRSGAAQFAFSADGSLLYAPGESKMDEHTLLWIDRQGKVQPLPFSGVNDRGFRLSPDGRRLAVAIAGPNVDVWVYDLVRGTSDRLTFDTAIDTSPVWTPDGKQVTFASNRAGTMDLYWTSADGSGSPVRLYGSEHPRHPRSWTPDGKALAISEVHPSSGGDIWVLSLEGEGEREAKLFLSTPFDEREPRFSPDGRWIAYSSNESGQFEVYVLPYAGPGERTQISVGGGEQPVWNPKGAELFYRSGEKIMVVGIETKPELTASKARLLFETPGLQYDITPDSKRFVMLKRIEGDAGPTQINVVL